MPTKPLEAILYRELSVAQAKEIITISSPLLQELVNFSTNALVRCATSTSGEENEDVAALALYRHIIEITDGAELLISQSCALPAIPLVRSSFEALIATEYILETNRHYVERSLSWLASHVHRKINFYESLIPKTGRGAEFQKLLQNDKTIHSTITLPNEPDVQRAIDNLRHFLARPQFQSVEMEFKQQKKKQNWFSLFGGPKDIRSLAQHLKRDAQYDILYREWSTTIHAQDFSPFVAVAPQGQSGIRALRDPNQLKDVVSFAASFILNATRIVLKKFRPSEDLTKWYKTEVQERYLQIVKGHQNYQVRSE